MGVVMVSPPDSRSAAGSAAVAGTGCQPCFGFLPLRPWFSLEKLRAA